MKTKTTVARVRVSSTLSGAAWLPRSALCALLGLSACSRVEPEPAPTPTSIQKALVTGTHAISVFPQRDFISASGYAANDLVVVKVRHANGTVWSTNPNTPIVPSDDPRAALGDPFAGIVEVNHPGGACWFGTTPDIRPGDVVELDLVAGPATSLAGLSVLSADTTVVSNVTAGRPVQTGPGSFQVHGTAVANDGVSQIPVAELEQRMVAGGNPFEVNARRTLRATSAAGADGLLSYDGPGLTSWTATYSGLSPADIARALAAESRGMWLGTAVLPAVEGTIYELGAAVVPGPAAPCTAPLEILPPPPGSELVPPSSPQDVAANVSASNTVSLTWTASTDNVGVTSYGIYRDGIAISNVQSPSGQAPAPTNFLDKNVAAGTYTYTIDAADAVGNRSAWSSGVTVTTAAQLAPALPRCGTGATPCVNEPPVAPVQIIAFPSRDFVSSSGFEQSDTVDVQVIRNGAIVSTAAGQLPQADPRAAANEAFAGLVEINHPGGGCWEGVTPELRAGDLVRTIAYRSDGTIRTVDQSSVSSVTAFRPTIVRDDNAATQAPDGIIEIHGTAVGANGKPLPLDQLDQRLVANRDAFDSNARRTLRTSSGDGTLSYDVANNPTGINWTARYAGLSADDVARAVGGVSSSTGRRFPGAESRMLWLGSAPLVGTELTIYENSDAVIPGPAAGLCSSTLERADIVAPSTPLSLTATPRGTSDVLLNWSGSSDDWYVYGYRVFRDGQPVANVAGSITSYLDQTVMPGPHSYAVAAFDSASARGPGATIIDQLSTGLGLPYGNLSPLSSATGQAQNDVSAPSVPTSLVALASVGKVSLTWAASVDDVGVDRYEVYRDRGQGLGFELIANPQTTNYVDSSGVGTFRYAVDALDVTGNRSALSAAVTAVVTAVPDVTAPSWPNNNSNNVVRAAVDPDIHGRNVALTWVAATDDVAVTGYNIYRNGALVLSVNGSTLSYLDQNLPTATYGYAVEAFDSSNNRSARTATASAVVANDPPLAPHSIIAFPASDFVSATGYTPFATYTYSLLRGGLTVFSAPFAADSTGLIEVNHPGGTCWVGTTPDVRPGDVVRLTDSNGLAEQTTVSNVTVERPVATGPSTVVVRGAAVSSDGVTPIDIGQLEHRLIANQDRFDLGGKRTLRAGPGLDGTLSYDAVGSTHWTARYTNLSATDIVRAVGGSTTDNVAFVGAESRAIWLGRSPLALTEQTIFENGSGVVGGPSAPCTATPEAPVASATFTPASLSFGAQSFMPPTSSAPQTVTFSSGSGLPLVLSNIYFAGQNPGDFTRVAGGSCPVAFPATLPVGASCTVLVRLTPGALGLRQANLSFSDNAANTTDQTVTLTGIGINVAEPVISVTPGTVAFGTVNGGGAVRQTISVRNTGGGQALTVSALAFGGTNAADFTLVSQTCTSTPVASNGGSCNIVVEFRPSARGARAGTLVLTHGAAAPSHATSTSVALTGTGGNGAVLAFDKNPITWGTISRNTTKDQTATLKNSGNAAASLPLSSFAVTAPFTIVSSTCNNLAVNNACNVVVRLPAQANVTSFTGTLSVTVPNGLPARVVTTLTASTK